MRERRSMRSANVMALNRGSRPASSGMSVVTGLSRPGSVPSAAARAIISESTVLDTEKAAAGRSGVPPLPYHWQTSFPACTTTRLCASAVGRSARGQVPVGQGGFVAATAVRAFYSTSVISESRCHSTQTTYRASSPPAASRNRAKARTAAMGRVHVTRRDTRSKYVDAAWTSAQA